MDNFRQAYKALNAAQRQAVDAIDGPVLVVAGPGTGKTQLLSLRVANILQNTDIDASGILCLTFTNKAATNMRERLQRLIGPASRNVVVRTFHSFAMEIMGSYPDYFWQGARLSVAPDAVQLEIVQNILASLPLDNPLASKFAEAFTALGDTKQALKLAKEAGLTPENLHQIIKENIQYIDEIEPLLANILAPALSAKKLADLQAAISQLPAQKVASPLIKPLDEVIKQSLDFAITQDEPTGKTTNTGKWKLRFVQTIDGQKVMNKERTRNVWWLAVADVYEIYRQQLHHSGYYDYSDMLIEVLTQLEHNAELRSDIQERFLYILIDEFQDTNAAQLQLAHLVADHYAANNRPNLMAVGDDDQSIFAFNGAELNNVLNFRSSYPDTKLIVLQDNYRSSQAVLDTAGRIIQLADDRLVNREPDITKNLVAKNPPATPGRIEHLSYPTREHQHLAVARLIKKMWDDSQRTVAVLARQHDSLQQLASILLKMGVPISYERRNNVLENEAVKTISLIARLAVSIADGDRAAVNLGLAELVRHPMWGISSKTLWQLAISNYSQPDWLASLLEHEDKQLQKLGGWLTWLARHSAEVPVPLTLEYLLGLREGQYLLSPLRDYYLSSRQTSSDYLETLSAVELLRGLAQEFAGGGQTTLADFMRFIDLNLRNKNVIADESWFMSSGPAVQLLTVYKAKGLEFDSVFVIDLAENIWSPRAARRASPANLRLESYGEKSDDYVRLLYVAASRAKHSLIATSYFTGSRGEEILPTPLISDLPLQKIDQPVEAAVEVLEASLAWPRLESHEEHALLAGRLENFALSPSSFINFLNVAEAGPASFMERHLLRLPAAHSVAGSYGTAIHAALETAQRLTNSSKFAIASILDRFASSLQAEHLLPLDYEQCRAKGETLLTRLFQENLLTFTKGGQAEQPLKDILLATAVIGGKLDRLDTPGKNELLITDYKTGKALNSLDTTDKTKAVKAWRHKTQLTLYCLLARHSARFHKLADIRAQIIYVEAEPKHMLLSFTPAREDLDKTEQLAEAVWQHVMKLDFPDTQNYSPDIDGIQKFEQDLRAGKI